MGDVVKMVDELSAGGCSCAAAADEDGAGG